MNALPVAPPDPALSGGAENTSAAPDLRAIPLQEEIAACARELWLRYGRPVGRDEQIWLEAERQLLGVDREIALVGGPTPADALHQAAPAAFTAGPGGASPGVSPDPASSGASGA